MNFTSIDNKDIRQIGWFVYDRETRQGNRFAGVVAQIAADQAQRSPSYRREIETEIAWSVWAAEVEAEQQAALDAEDESNARMAHHVCPDCGQVVPVDRKVNEYPCYCWEMAEAEQYAEAYEED